MNLTEALEALTGLAGTGVEIVLKTKDQDFRGGHVWVVTLEADRASIERSDRNLALAISRAINGFREVMV